LEYSLFFNKNLSQKLGSCGWGPGRDDLGQKCLNLSHLWCHPQKAQIPKLYKFFKNPIQKDLLHHECLNSF